MRSVGVVQFVLPVGFGGRVGGWWWLVVVVALACGAVVLSGALSGPAASPRANGVRGAAAVARVQSLPLQAQSVISARLGAGAASFAARRSGDGYRLAGGGVVADFGGRGALMRVAGGSLSMALTGVGRGGRFGSSGAVSLGARANRVSLRRAGLREWYAAGPLGIEQGFTVASRPAGASGPVVLALRLGGSLRARAAGSRVRFVTRAGGVAARYGGLVAVDARGRRLPATLALVGTSLRLRVADRGARYPLRIDPFVQQGAKLTGSDEVGLGEFGLSVALSADGDTALIGGRDDNGSVGAAWAFTRSGGVWAQQGAKLTGSGETGNGEFGWSVALSADGNTAMIGGQADNGNVGAAWAFTRSAGVWTQQGPKLTGSDESGGGLFGLSVALSADGDTAMIGGDADNLNTGAAWAFGSPHITSPPSLAFGSQTTGQPGPVDWLPVVNTGHAPLTFTGPAQITGPNAADFAIPAGNDRCNAATLKRDQLCWVGVQLTAAAGGPRTATLSFGANNTYPPNATVSLTGTGVAPNSGPQGSTGPQGPPGAAGPGGKLVLVAFQARVSTKRVVVSYALTGPADIALGVARKGSRLRTVAHKRGRAGVNRITWNRKLADKRAKRGTYRLIVTATANKKKATSTLRIRLR